MKDGRPVLKCAALTATGAALCLMLHLYSCQWRGRETIGGEALLLLLPVFWCAIGRVVSDFAHDIKDNFRQL